MQIPFMSILYLIMYKFVWRQSESVFYASASADAFLFSIERRTVERINASQFYKREEKKYEKS